LEILQGVTNTKALGGPNGPGDYELKTHQDGKATITNFPYRKAEVEVIAPGFKTFKQIYSINQRSMMITIKLEKPST